MLVREILHVILQFKEACDTFYNYCLTESAKRDNELDNARGVFTGLDHLGDHQTADTLPRIQRRIKEYSATYSERVQVIVHSLQSHPDLDCRFLAIRLSFSDFYKTKKDAQAK